MSAAAGGGRALGGDAGYKRLVRLLGRAFYSGECPPREAEEEGPAGARTTRRDKNEYIGLGVLLLDLLAAAHGYVKDATITGTLGVSGKVANRALRYLQAEGLLTSEVTRIKVRRQNVAQPDDPDVEQKMSQLTNTWWCVAYPALMDMLQLRLHLMRELLKRHMGHGGDVAEYLCRRCGATYTSLDAAALLDPASGTFRCEECGGELGANLDAAGLGGGGAAAAASRQQLQQYARGMQDKMEAQLRPVLDQLEKLKGVPPPDFGSLRDWHVRQFDLQKRRQEQAARARQKMAERGGSHDELDDDQVLDWLARADVDVQLGGEGAADAAAAGPGKELPAWFRGGGESESVGPGGSGEAGGEGDGAQQPGGGGEASAQEQRALQEAFLAQYLAQVRAAAAKRGRNGGDDDDKVEPDSKRLKTENGAVGVKAEAWEDVKAEQQPLVKAEPQQPQQEPAGGGGGGGADEDEWEDI